MNRLITTGIDRQIDRCKLDSGRSKNVVYLGSWCIPFANYGEEGQAIVTYHWDNREQVFFDYKYIQCLTNRILPLLADQLDQIHGLNLSHRAWRLIIGYWLQLFLTVAFDRWQMLTRARDCYFPLFTELHRHHPQDFHPLNTEHACELFFDDKWNHVFIGEMLESIGGIEVKPSIHLLKTRDGTDAFPYSKQVEKVVKSVSKKILFGAISKLLSIGRDSNLQLVLCLNERNYIDLAKLSGQVNSAIIYQPQFPSFSQIPWQNSLRNWEIVNDEGDSAFEVYVKKAIAKWIPISFIEGFKKTWAVVCEKEVNCARWVIVTQGRHFLDDSFKIWCADKIARGGKLVCVQHGGGLNKFNLAMKHEASIADLYAVNGSGDNTDPKNRDVGLTWGNIKCNSWNPDGTALLVCVAMPRYAFDMRSMAISGQMQSYFNDQYNFYRSLPEKLRSEVRIRLYNQDYGWCQASRWSFNFAKIRFDDSRKSIKDSAKKSRIIICTYNASSFLEMLSANIPTIIFWNRELWEIPSSAENDFIDLNSVGIFHGTPESAAKQMTAVWERVNDWWSSKELQHIRQSFCRKYAFRTNGMIDKLADVINEVADKM